MLVPIFLGSHSDIAFAQRITTHLDEYGIPYEIVVSSAHKVPEKLLNHIRRFEATGEKLIFVTIAGRSNGLSGVTAGNTRFPVIACPPHDSKDDFMVNINSTLQMPSDTPVLTVCDPQNCAMTILRIFGLSDQKIQDAVADRIKKIKDSFND